jgi:hypothetical protein
MYYKQTKREKWIKKIEERQNAKKFKTLN